MERLPSLALPLHDERTEPERNEELNRMLEAIIPDQTEARVPDMGGLSVPADWDQVTTNGFVPDSSGNDSLYRSTSFIGTYAGHQPLVSPFAQQIVQEPITAPPPAVQVQFSQPVARTEPMQQEPDAVVPPSTMPRRGRGKDKTVRMNVHQSHIPGAKLFESFLVFMVTMCERKVPWSMVHVDNLTTSFQKRDLDTAFGRNVVGYLQTLEGKNLVRKMTDHGFRGRWAPTPDGFNVARDIMSRYGNPY